VVDQTIEQMGLSPLALRPVSDLSGGEAQKVMIARALAQSPSILLLDEPTSNLDLKNQMEVMALVRSVVKTRGLMAIVAIHDLNLAVRFADRFLFVKDHRVHALATRDELCADTIAQVYGIEVLIEKVGGHQVVVPV
jgi:iron complex transport system ATP-binding protein